MPPTYADAIAKLFRPRPKLRFISHDISQPMKYSGIGSVLQAIKSIKLPDPGEPILPYSESKIKNRQMREEANNKKIALLRAQYEPKKGDSMTSDPYATLFIGNLPADVTEEMIRDEMEVFGKIRQVKFVFDKISGARRPYCFVEYEKEADFKVAMSQGRRLHFGSKRMIVDCERRRTVEGWLPRRLGGEYGGQSRRFQLKEIVREALNCRKRKRYGWKYGKSYTGAIEDFKRRRDMRLGIERTRGRGRRDSRN